MSKNGSAIRMFGVFISYSELSQKKTGFFKEKTAGFSSQIHRVTQKQKPGVKKTSNNQS